MTTISGEIPFFCIDLPEGVKYLAVVILKAPYGFTGIIVCTEPLPKDCVPKIIALLWSCKAPATISDAEAEPPFIRTTSGKPLITSPGLALYVSGFSESLPRVETISPFSKKRSET